AGWPSPSRYASAAPSPGNWPSPPSPPAAARSGPCSSHPAKIVTPRRCAHRPFPARSASRPGTASRWCACALATARSCAAISPPCSPRSIADLCRNSGSIEGSMNLTPREKDKLLIAMAAIVARRRLDRGVRLNHPEAVALISDFILEGARDGKSVADLMQTGAHVITRAQVMDGIAEMIPEIQVEATF